MGIKIQHLDHVAVTSKDPEKSIAFYRDVLGLSVAYEWPGDLTMLRGGDTFVAIAWCSQGKAHQTPPPITVDHIAFRVDAETFNKARLDLEKHGIVIEQESDHGISRSLYFRDPDRHLLELACYEIKGAQSKMPKVF